MGQVGTGKTYTLFGAEDAAPSSEGICVRLLAALFDRIHDSSRELGRITRESKYYRVGLSTWEVGATEVTDLLTEKTQSTLSSSEYKSVGVFLNVAVEDLSEALQVIEISRSRSSNWRENNKSGIYTPQSNRRHSFLRISLHDVARQRASSLHLVDLVGNAPLSAQASQIFQRQSTSDRERRGISQQLLSLGRFLSQVADRTNLTPSQVLDPRPLMARGSRLNECLYGLVGGNCKTMLLCTLSSDPADFVDNQQTLRAAIRAMAITSLCHRSLGVSIADFPLSPIAHHLTVACRAALSSLPNRRAFASSIPAQARVPRLLPDGNTAHGRRAQLEAELTRCRANQVACCVAYQWRSVIDALLIVKRFADPLPGGSGGGRR